jgi:hypothetical protein
MCFVKESYNSITQNLTRTFFMNLQLISKAKQSKAKQSKAKLILISFSSAFYTLFFLSIPDHFVLLDLASIET